MRKGTALLVTVLALVGCDDTPEEGASAPEGQTEDAVPDELTEVEMVALMEAHYNAAITAHDALIRGDLEMLRTRLAEIESRPLPSAAPDDWRPFDASLQEASRNAADATSLETAAPHMAAVAEACGECHAHVARGPVYRRPLPPEGESEVETAMLGHQWATERLWEGVTGPWGEAWQRGADALAESRVFEPEDQGSGVSESLLEQEEALRELGRTARETTGLRERARVYGRLLATCGDCHREAGVTLEAAD